MLVVGTYDAEGKANAMTAAWGGILGENEIMIFLAKHKTTDNIAITNEFTVSIGDALHVEACDYIGMVSANEMEKFALPITDICS